MSDKPENTGKKRYSFMQNRELSWLEFNKRVLDQSADPSVPLLERLSFLSIYWSNLQEFFMIRVGSLTDLSLVKKTIIDSKSGMTPNEQLEAVYKRCHELYPYYESCYKELRKAAMAHGIVNKSWKSLTEDQREYVADYFEANIMPFLSPQIINARHPFPHLENGALYIVVRLDEEAGAESKKKSKADKAAKDKKHMGAEGVTLGIIPLPRQCSRIIKLPGRGMQFMLLEHVIEMFVQSVFSMYKVKHTNVICVTRNADLDAAEGTEEQGEDYREHIKKILKKRTRLMPVRLETEKELSATVKPVLLDRLNLHNLQTFVSKVPLDLSYVYDIAGMLPPELRAELSAKPFTPQWPSTLDPKRSIIEQVNEREVLLSYPYESMDAFIQMLREAATDPDVVSIRITLYRLAKQSHLAEALIAAAENGKEVTALFELRARFDESNNIEWSQRFEQAGCRVIYGFRDYKVHSKICCITRQTPNSLQVITQLGTGNYNEKTARLYTDFSFITTDPLIGRDAMAFFRNMTLESLSDEYRYLWVAPLQIKQNIIAGIDEQIANKKAGKPAGLFFKTNSITDKEVIDKIVEASQAGVQCTLLVRGISCIVPGIKGYTDNVCVVSIVGRLLEHSRIYLFGPFDGDFKVYLSSADLMTRNMDKRIEIAWPITNPVLRDQILGYIGACMADTAKLRDLLPNRKYTDLGYFAKADKENGQVVLFDSQAYLINEAQRKRLESDEQILGAQRGDIDKDRDIANDELEIERLGEEVSEFEHLKEEGVAVKDDRSLDGMDAAATAFEAIKRVGDEPEEMKVDAPIDGNAGMEAFGEEAFEFVDAFDPDDEDAIEAVEEDTADVAGSVEDDVADVVEVDELADDADNAMPVFASEDAVAASEPDGLDAADVAAMAAIAADVSDEEEDVSGDVDMLKLPNIENLYKPEHNPEGKFTVPTMTGAPIEIDRVGGPVIAEEEQAEAIDDFAPVEPLSEEEPYEQLVEQQAEAFEQQPVVAESIPSFDWVQSTMTPAADAQPETSDIPEPYAEEPTLGEAIEEIQEGFVEFAPEGTETQSQPIMEQSQPMAELVSEDFDMQAQPVAEIAPQVIQPAAESVQQAVADAVPQPIAEAASEVAEAVVSQQPTEEEQPKKQGWFKRMFG